jgi:lysophospholipase L1-like esterase
MVAVRIRPAIVLFGDSITQQGFGHEGRVGWASLLAADYSRRADVLNRGFSGYNTEMAVDLLPSIFGSPAPPLKNNNNDDKNGILFCTVFFGANDAALKGERQHVPIQDYANNLATIVDTIR